MTHYKFVFRSMKEDKQAGTPLITPNKTSGLGIRGEIDIDVDENGFVHPDVGGMTAFIPPIENIHPNFRPPKSKNSVWKIDTSVLGGLNLKYVLDNSSPGHGTIQPSYSMSYADYENALYDTKAHWEKLSGDENE